MQQFAKLFILPSVYHCQGGTGPSRVDWLTPIMAWVEQGTSPTQIIASQTPSDSPEERLRQRIDWIGNDVFQPLD